MMTHLTFLCSFYVHVIINCLQLMGRHQLLIEIQKYKKLFFVILCLVTFKKKMVQINLFVILYE